MKINYNYSSVFLIIFITVITGCSSSIAKHSKSYQSNKGGQVVRHATAVIGKPYNYGGNTAKGFDCSGLVHYAHHKAGITVPRTTREQLKQAKPIKHTQLRPGDLVFFRLNGRKVSHVGIYIGNNKMIHAPSSGKRVSYASLDNPYWKKHLISAGRLH